MADQERCYDVGKKVEALFCRLDHLRYALVKRDVNELDQSLKRLSSDIRMLSDVAPEAAVAAKALKKRAAQLSELIGGHTNWRTLKKPEAALLFDDVHMMFEHAAVIGATAGGLCGARPGYQQESNLQPDAFQKIGKDIQKIAKEERIKAERKWKIWHDKAMRPYTRGLKRKK